MKTERVENYHGRPAWFTRAIVDAGVELKSRNGLKAAADFLWSQGVPLKIAHRILVMADGNNRIV